MYSKMMNNHLDQSETQTRTHDGILLLETTQQANTEATRK